MTLIRSCLILLGLNVPSLWEDKPAWDQGATSPFRQREHPPYTRTGRLLAENPSLGGSSTAAERNRAGQKQHTASTLGLLGAGKSWSDVQITSQGCWFSGRSCRIWSKGQLRNRFCFSTHLHSTEAGPHDTAAVEAARKNSIQSILK